MKLRALLACLVLVCCIIGLARAQPGVGTVEKDVNTAIESAVENRGQDGEKAKSDSKDAADQGKVKESDDASAEALEPIEALIKRVYSWLDARMPEVLRGPFLGIQHWQYIVAFLCVLAGLVLKKISDYVFEHVIIRAAVKTRWHFDQLIAEAVSKPTGVVFLLLGLWMATAMLNLDAQVTSVRRFVRYTILVAFAVDFLWFLFRMVDVLAAYMMRAAARTDSKLDDQLVPLIKKSLKVFVGLLIFIAVLQTLGLNVGSLLAGLGIGGLAVAMAAQDTLANIFGGLVIFTDHPFRLGDWVKIGDVEGTVEQIGFRSTRVRTFPKTLVTIPNKKVVDEFIDNKTAMPVRRIRTTVGVTYETKAAEMEALLEDFKAILRKDEGVDQEYIVVRFLGFGASSLDVLLQYFTKPIDYDGHLEVVERINLAVMRAVEDRGLSIAFPTRTVYFEGDIARGMAGMSPKGHEE